MAESGPPDSLPSEAPDFGPLVDMNSFYGYGPNGIGAVYETADRARRVTPTMPAWMEEGTYEYENNWGHFSGKPWDTRRGRFWSVLGGATAGDGFGSKDVWQWENIPASLHVRRRHATRLRRSTLFGTLPWWELQPSGTDPGSPASSSSRQGRARGAISTTSHRPSRPTTAGCWRTRR